jgi:hypothetical protein
MLPLEPEVQRGAVAAQGELRLACVDEPAVRGTHAGLHDLPHQLEPGREVVELHACAPALDVARADPHPRLGDHGQRALRAEQQPVGRRAGARGRQAARLPDIAADRDGADRLDEVVDVRRAGGEMTGCAGGDPAAERRPLERLRVEAQRHPVLGELLLDARAGGTGLDARRA